MLESLALNLKVNTSSWLAWDTKPNLPLRLPPEPQLHGSGLGEGRRCGQQAA